jgi:hypothetical protein
MKILIATATIPNSPEGFDIICGIIRDSIRNDENLELVSGILLTGGRGCANMALEVTGKESCIESFATSLTMALMPAKWSEGCGIIPDEDTNEIGYKS